MELLSEDRIHRISAPRRPPLGLSEILLVTLASVWFIVATWWLGGVQSKPQIYLLVISVVALLVALVFPYGWSYPMADRVRRLLQFPVFWLGLLLFGYMGVQLANPERMVFQFEGKIGVITKDLRGLTGDEVAQMTVGEFNAVPEFSPLSWMPTSIHAPFESRNPARVMVQWGSVWILVCALWVGITRRRSLHLMLLTIVLNATAFALVAIFQEIYHVNKILGFINSPVNTFVGTFIYRGHGAAFMNCGIVLALGMFFHYGKVKRSAEASGFTLIYMIASLVMTVGVMMSGSRMGMICCGVFWGIFLLVFIHDWIQQRWTSPAKLGTCVLGGITLGIVFVILGTKEFESSFNRFKYLDSNISVDYRMSQNRSTWQMIQDRPWFGWGAGSYRWAFPPYQQHNPDLQPRKWNKHGISFPHAHNDILQPLAELGIIGMLPLLGMLLFWFQQIWRSYRYLDRGLVLMSLGTFVLLAHAFTDPLFHSTAIVGMWAMALLSPVFAAKLMRTRLLGVNPES